MHHVHIRFSAIAVTIDMLFVMSVILRFFLFITFQDNIRDITDSLIDHCEDRKLDENSNVQVSDEKIVGIVNDLFGAGESNFSSAHL